MTTFQVFVYGTLINMHKGRFGGGAKLIDEAKTRNKYHLFGGGFPLAILPGHKALTDSGVTVPETSMGKIRGQVFEVTEDIFHGLDNYEGYPEFYDRTEVEVENPEGKVFKAWMYHGSNDPVASAARSIPRRPVMLPDETGTVVWDAARF